jgi:hypothetical protein
VCYGGVVAKNNSTNMDQNLSRLTKVGNWIATLLLGNTRELIIRTDERLSNFIVEMREFKTETKEEFREIRGILKEHSNILFSHTGMLREHSKEIAGIKEDVQELKEDVRELKMDVSALKVYVGYNIRHSPNVPSEKGKKLLKESGFYEIYPQIKQRVFALIEKRQPKTLYDYEKEAESALRSLRDDPLAYRLKDYVIEHEDQPLVLIFEIASWVVRDDYLKEHPLPPR